MPTAIYWKKRLQSGIHHRGKSNLASLGANLKNNLKVAAHNSLIKFFGMNIFSTYRNGRFHSLLLIKPDMQSIKKLSPEISL